jgi:hypothetical protein
MSRQKYLIGCFGILWVGMIVSSLSSWAFAESSPVTKIAVPGPAAVNPQPNAEDVQRAEAHKHIPELIFFVLITVTLGILLRLKAHDLEKLRKEGFFHNPDQSKDPH